MKTRLARSVYIHVPFCRHRCGYCNFPLVAGRDYLIDRYLDAIAKEIATVEGRIPIDTLYFGGGTPSHLNPEQLSRLRTAVDQRFELADNAEFTAECNPSDLNQEKADSLQAIGVNRISLGVQSFNDHKLKLLERDHNIETVARAAENARKFCQSLSIDLIFAVGDETLSQWLTDLEHTNSVDPDHVSIYELTFEKGTRFWTRLQRDELEQSREELRVEMLEIAVEHFCNSGFEHYEISSLAKPGHRSRHNQVYWSGNSYFAFGPGASRFLDGVRETNHASPSTYLKKIEMGNSVIAMREQLSPEALARELLAIGLRRIDGVNLSEFKELTGYSAADLAAPFLNRYESHQFLELRDHDLKLSPDGILVADWVSAELIGGDSSG